LFFDNIVIVINYRLLVYVFFSFFVLLLCYSLCLCTVVGELRIIKIRSTLKQPTKAIRSKKMHQVVIGNSTYVESTKNAVIVAKENAVIC